MLGVISDSALVFVSCVACLFACGFELIVCGVCVVFGFRFNLVCGVCVWLLIFICYLRDFLVVCYLLYLFFLWNDCLFGRLIC